MPHYNAYESFQTKKVKKKTKSHRKVNEKEE